MSFLSSKSMKKRLQTTPLAKASVSLAVTLLHDNNKTHLQKPKPPKGKQAEAHFAIVHYAGTVSS